MKTEETNDNHGKFIDIIKNTPTWTREYKEAVKELSKTKWAERFGNDNILVCDRDFIEIEHNIPNKPIHLPNEQFNLLEERIPTNNNKTLKYLPRKEVEMDVRYIQFISSIALHDGNSILTIRSKHKNTLGIPGGHIDYTFSSLGQSLEDVAKLSAIREFKEEINLKNKALSYHELRAMRILSKPILFDNSSLGWDKFRHRAIMYEYKTDTSLHHWGFSSNEPDKHTIEVSSIQRLYTEIRECEMDYRLPQPCDDWLKAVIIHIVENR